MHLPSQNTLRLGAPKGRSPEPELVLLFTKTNASVDLTLATSQLAIECHTGETCIKLAPDTFISLFPSILHHWNDDINERISLITTFDSLSLTLRYAALRYRLHCVICFCKQ